MTLAIDAILIFTAVFCVWTGARRGFVRSVMGLVSSVVSMIAAYAFTPAVAAWIRQRFLTAAVTDKIEAALHSLSFDTSTDLFNLDRVLSDMPESFNALLERYHVNLSDISAGMRGVFGADTASVRSLSEKMASTTSVALSSGLAFLVLFFAAMLVMSLLTLLLDAIFRMPALRTANIFLGVLMGVAEAVLLVSVFSLTLDVVVRALSAFDSVLFGDEVVNNTVICSFVVNFLKENVLSHLTGVLPL